MKSNKPLVLIMCGGKSLRLWPLSQTTSKNFLNIFGFSPLELTIKRFLKVTSRENIFLVANKIEKKELLRLKLVKKTNIIFEPASRDTAAAILLSLLKLEKYSSRNIIISPVDHLINKENEFYKALSQALAAAERGFICTLGVKPKEPTPNFGYIQVKPGKNGIYPIRRFIEKPKPSTARKLIASGNCFYNSGIFIASLRTLAAEYKKYYPEYNLFLNLIKKNKTAALYKKIRNIPFDRAIMEKTKKGALVKATFNWKDFGSWHTIYEILPKDKKGNVNKGASFIYDSKNNLIYLDKEKKKVLALGLEDIFFIDTKDYTLLTSRTYLDKLKTALKRMQKR